MKDFFNEHNYANKLTSKEKIDLAFKIVLGTAVENNSQVRLPLPQYELTQQRAKNNRQGNPPHRETPVTYSKHTQAFKKPHR